MSRTPLAQVRSGSAAVYPNSIPPAIQRSSSRSAGRQWSIISASISRGSQPGAAPGSALESAFTTGVNRHYVRTPKTAAFPTTAPTCPPWIGRDRIPRCMYTCTVPRARVFGHRGSGSVVGQLSWRTTHYDPHRLEKFRNYRFMAPSGVTSLTRSCRWAVWRREGVRRTAAPATG